MDELETFPALTEVIGRVPYYESKIDTISAAVPDIFR